MALTLAVKGTQVSLQPMPEEITFSNSQTYASYKVIGTGSIDVPSGVDVREISFETDLFGEKLKNMPGINPEIWTDPQSIKNTLNEWQKSKKIVDLIIGDKVSGLKYKNQVTIAEAQTVDHGATGNVNLSLTLKVKRDLTVETVSAKSKKKGKIGIRPQTTDKANTSLPTTYTVKKGDTMWSIAAKFYGDGKKWDVILKKNAQTALIQLARYQTSGEAWDNFGEFFAGTMLTIPKL